MNVIVMDMIFFLDVMNVNCYCDLDVLILMKCFRVY